MYKKRLTNGNKKVKALLFSMSPITSCLNSTSCASTCYAVKAYKQYPNVKLLWDSNLDLAKNDLFSLYDDICKQLDNTKQTIVRIHQSGDFISQEYLNMWIDIAKRYPHIMFYGYTKVDHILDFNTMDTLPNVNIIRSMINGKRNYGSISYVTKLATEYNAVICPATNGEDVKCGESCFKCMEKDTKVVFVQH